MTEKSGVSYPPLSDEDLARYGGPPELAYLPLVSIANELIAARAALYAPRQAMTREVAEGIAWRAAVAAMGREDAPGYLRDAHRADWKPHSWVVDAVLAAASTTRPASANEVRLRAEVEQLTDRYDRALIREKAQTDRADGEEAARRSLKAEVERLTADLVEVEARRRQVEKCTASQLDEETKRRYEERETSAAKLAATGHAYAMASARLARTEAELANERKVHAETHRQLAQINADHNALLLHLHAICAAAGLVPSHWGDIVATVSDRLRDKDELLTRLEALCHRLEDNDVPVTEDNDVPVTAETPTWIGYLEAGIAKLIEQRDGACARREAEETARIKADANAVFEAQRTDLATALGMTGDWNTLVRGAVQLRRLHAELTTDLIAIDRALEGGPQTSATNRAMRIRDILSILGERRRQIQDATQKLCKALGIADTATLGFAVETAVGLIGDTPRREPLLERRLIAGGPKLAAQGDLARRIRASKYIQHLDSIQGDHDWLRDATDSELLDAVFARVDAADRLEAELDAVRQQIEEARPLMPVSPARAELLREQDDRIKALEEHNQEMHESVAVALGRERGGAGVGWKDLIADIQRLREIHATVSTGHVQQHRSCAVAVALDPTAATWEDIVAAIERQGADLREAKANADAVTTELASIGSKRIATVRVGVGLAKAYKAGGDSPPLNSDTTTKIADGLVALVDLLGWS